MDKSLEDAKLHFGDIDGDELEAIITQNMPCGTRGGFQINGMHISPQNYGSTLTRHRVVIDYDSDYPYMLLRIFRVEKARDDELSGSVLFTLENDIDNHTLRILKEGHSVLLTEFETKTLADILNHPTHPPRQSGGTERSS